MSGEQALLVHSRDPYNAEPDLARLAASFVTAQNDFYVRCHSAIPTLQETTHRLRVDGLVAHSLTLSITELRDRFQKRTIEAVMQCAGNRRGDLRAVRPVSGDPWNAGAIGNAVWTGVSLADVLRAAGVAEAGQHVVLTGADEGFEVSIPIGKAMAPEVVLAYAMNGEVLAPEHGFPLRAVVPGFAGVRNAKWLSRIAVRERPSDARYQAQDYKMFPSDVTAESVDWDSGVTINEMPLNAAILEPGRHAEVPAGSLTVRGYAIAGGRAIARVDVSADGGRSWRQAVLDRGAGSPWAWTFWWVRVELEAGDHELAVRAWDSAGQTQPSVVDDVWNFKGYLCASWHRVPLRVV